MRRSVAIGRGIAVAAAIGLALTPALALAAQGDGRPAFGDDPLPPPPTYQANDVGVDEHLGAQIPLDARFRTSDGATVTLSQVLAQSELPTILTFNYSDCPMLCSVQLNGLTKGLPPLATADGEGKPALVLGAHYRVVTIDLDPSEPHEKLAAMKKRYVDQLGVSLQALGGADHVDASGWTFLQAETSGDGAEIARVAEAVGFRYLYLKDKAQYAHPAALILLSARGVVTRYVYGIEYAADDMRQSIIKAGTAEPSTAVGFMTRCYHFDPGANDHSRAGVMAMRVGAATCVFALLSVLGVARLRKRRPPGKFPLSEESRS